MLYSFPVGGDELLLYQKSVTTEQILTSMLFCSECVFGGMNEDVKQLSFGAIMRVSFCLAVCFTVIHLSFILRVGGFSKLTIYIATNCTFILSLFGYILSAISSIIIKEEPAFLMFYNLSVIIGIFQLFVHTLWLFGVISIVNNDDDEVFDVDGEETSNV